MANPGVEVGRSLRGLTNSLGSVDAVDVETVQGVKKKECE